jgi:hypothetical protein
MTRRISQAEEAGEDLKTNALAPDIQSYEEHLAAGRYGSGRRRRYLASVAHFGRWLTTEGYTARGIDEPAVRQFVSGHLPRCSCPRPVSVHALTNQAALNHLLGVLRSRGVIASPPDDEIARELARFDAKMAEVWDLSKATRDHRRRIIRLSRELGSRSLDPSLRWVALA